MTDEELDKEIISVAEKLHDSCYKDNFAWSFDETSFFRLRELLKQKRLKDAYVPSNIEKSKSEVPMPLFSQRTEMSSSIRTFLDEELSNWHILRKSK